MANQWDFQTPSQNTSSQGRANSQTNQNQRTADQTRQQSQPPPGLATPPGREAENIVQQTQENKRSTFKAGQATITAGKAGELCLGYKWIDVPFPDYDSARFDVTSTASNPIEVDIEQDVYKKKHAATGAIATGPIPRAPIGTKGRMIARDTVTGETIEVPWTWYDKGRRNVSLWQTIKRLIWKGDR